MRKRKKMNFKRSKKLFRRTGARVHKKNFPRIMRGGYRL